MDKPYSTLKSALILFCLLLGTAGCALLVLGLLANNFLNSHNVQSVSVGVVWLYILAGSCFLLSCLGVCGAYKEKKLLLRLFLGAMLGGSFSLFIFGMHGITASAQIKEGLSGSSMPDVVRAIMANEQQRTNLKVLEAKLGCCGLTGPSDWETDGGHVSDSCLCPSDEQQDTLRCANTTYKTYSRYLFNGREEITHTVSIYKEPCGPVLLDFVDRGIKVILGITFGFAITAIVGVMLSLSLIYSMGATEQQSGSNSNIPFHRFA